VTESLPVVMIPGLLCSARLYAQQVPALWRVGPVMIAEHTREDTMAGIAARILASAPPRFALVGLSMGGYIAFEILRQAPQRVVRLGLLDTAARPDTAEASAARRTQVGLATSGRFEEVIDALYTRLVHESRAADGALRELNRQMGREVGVDGYCRQQAANIARADSRPTLAAITCPTLVLVGDSDQLTPIERAQEIANGIPGARLVSVPRCGHLSSLEQPEAVNEALLALLQG
jgi:pimeloyl-ACP methyl ester carboxylesterase